MINKTTILSFFILFVFSVNAQISQGGLPYSFLKQIPSIDVPVVATDDLDWKTIEEENRYDEEVNNPPKMAHLFEVNYNLNNSGIWTQLQNGDRLWRLKIQTKDAKAVYLHYKDFYLPNESKLFVYSADRKQVIGAFTSYNNHKSGYFATELIHSDAVIIEYYEPAKQIGEGSITIERIGHAYRMVYNKNEQRDFGDSESCEVNVNCSPEGDNWQDQKQSSVRTLISNYWCSAAVINNTAQDCSPYVLTAFHCQQGISTNQFNQGIFYLNYYAPSCNNPSFEGTLDNTTMVGCSVVAGSNDNGGSSGSDYALYQLNNPIPQSYNTFYSGWNANNIASSSGASLHHPSGDIMKISTYTSNLQSTSWGNANGSHWRVYWSSTANGHGVTEGGSSGAPIYDSQGRIMGQLTGGSSYCQTPNSPDQYGKMSYNWQSNSNGDDLKDWLDPNNSGVTTLSGMYCGATIALDAGITTVASPSGSSCENKISPIITLKNFGSNTLTSVTINYNVDGGANNTYNWTGNLGSYATTTVTLPDLNSSNGNHTFNCYTSNPNGGSDGNSSNDNASSSFILGTGGAIVTLDLTLDCYGEEISWELVDDNNSTIYSVPSGTYPGGSSQTDMFPGGSTDEQEWCLLAGCYDFVISDTYGDGLYGSQWSCEVDGDYIISDQWGNVLAELIATNGDFGYQEINSFCVELSIDEISDNAVNVYPNPFTNTTTVEVNNNGYVYSVELLDFSGRKIQSYNGLIENKLVISAKNLSAGIYFVSVNLQNKTIRKKIILQ